MGQPWISVPGVEVGDELGRGAHGMVFRAQRGTEQFALKIPLPGALDALTSLRLHREGTRLARVSHPSLPKVMQVGQAGDVPYLLMELVDGFRLLDLLQEGPLSESQVTTMGLQVGGALREMHLSGLAHGDIHPRNIVFDRTSMTAFLVDFGYSTGASEKQERSPLRIRRDDNIDEFRSPYRRDLHQLGVLLARASSSLSTVASMAWQQCMAAPTSRADVALDALLPATGDELRQIVRRLLSSGDDGYLHVDDFLEDMSAFRGAREQSAAPQRRTRSLSYHGAASALTGRDSEYRSLESNLGEGQQGGRCFTFLEGESGTGKSVLLNKAIDQHLAGTGYLFARCDRQDPRPFAAIRQLLDDYLARTAKLTETERALRMEHLRETGEGVAGALCVLSPSLSGLFPDAVPLPALPHVEDVFIDAVAMFLSRWAASNTAILFDDIQWLDFASNRVLVRTLERSPQGSFVFAFRPHPERDGELLGLRSKLGESAKLIRLQPLDAEQIGNLITSHLGSHRVSAALSHYILSVSDGIPFDAVAVLNTLLDHGAVTPSWGEWTFNREKAAQIGLTAGAQQTTRRRIRELSESARKVVELAAVMGSTFSVELLEGMEGPRVVGNALREAEEALLIKVAETAAPTFHFAHEQIREALFDELQPEVKRELHERVADALDKRERRINAGTVPPERLYSIAQHHIDAGLRRHPGRTYSVCLQAARHAADSYDTDRALRFFRAAEEAAQRGDLDTELDFHRIFGETLVRSGAMQQGLQHLQHALRHTNSATERGLLHLRLAGIHRAELRSDEAWHSLENAFQAIGSRMPTESLRSVLRSLGSWIAARLWFRRRVTKPETRARLELLCELFQETTRLASETEKMVRAPLATLRVLGPSERLGPSVTLSRAYLLYSFFWMMLGFQRKSVRYGDKAEAIALSSNDPSAYAYALQIRFVIYIWGGRLDEALDLGARCVTQFGHWQDTRDYCFVGYSLQWIESLRGHASNAWVWMHRSGKRFERQGESSPLSNVIRHGLVASLTALGREEEVDSLLSPLPGPADEGAAGGELALWAFGPRIRAWTERGELDHGFESLVDEFERGHHNASKVHLLVSEFYLHLAHARIHQLVRACNAADRQRAGEALKKVHKQLQQAARIPLLKAHAQAVQGYVDWYEGNVSAAKKAFSEAEEAGQKETAPWVLFTVARGRAHLFRNQGGLEISRVTATVAAALAREFGHVHWLRWIREEFALDLSAGSRSHTTPPARARTIAPNASDAFEVHRLRAITNLKHLSNSHFTEEEKFNYLLDELIELFGAERGDLLFVAGETLSCLASRDARRRNHSPPGAVLQTFYSEVLSDSGSAVFQESGTWRGTPDSLLALPLTNAGRCVGVLGLSTQLGRGTFSETDTEQLNALSHQIWAYFSATGTLPEPPPPDLGRRT